MDFIVLLLNQFLANLLFCTLRQQHLCFNDDEHDLEVAEARSKC